jgi:large subunit ribosomal protein L9
MKVVLKKAVVKLGVPGDVIEVANGFAANWLIPQGIALHANKKNMEEFESKRHELIKTHEEEKNKALKIKESIENKAVLLAKPINDAGNLYAVINTSEIATALNEAFKDLNFEFLKNQVTISNKIRNYGIYDFSLILYNGVMAKLKLSVNGTKASAEEALKPKIEEKSLEMKTDKKVFYKEKNQDASTSENSNDASKENSADNNTAS